MLNRLRSPSSDPVGFRTCRHLRVLHQSLWGQHPMLLYQILAEVVAVARQSSLADHSPG